MEAALRTLSTCPKLERVQDYVRTQQDHQQTRSHAGDCICFECERIQVLKQRKERQRQKHAEHEGGNAQSGASTYRLPTKKRRRVWDENTRRAEAKLGRAAHLKPGRISLPLQSMASALSQPGPSSSHVVTQHRQTLTTDSSTPSPVKIRDAQTNPMPSSLPTNDGDDDADAHDDDASTWICSDHSAYSNQRHKLMAQNQSSADDPDQASLDQDPPDQHIHAERPLQGLTCSRLFDDFYLRNPIALANGWLAEKHHRDMLDHQPNAQPSRPAATTSLAQLFLHHHRHPLLGLCPRKSRTRQHRPTR